MGDLIFSDSFSPVLLPGDVAKLIGENKIVNIECVRVGALPEWSENIGNLTATTWSTDIEVTELELEDNVLAQIRMRVSFDGQLKMNNLGPTKQWKSRGGEFYLPQFPQADSEGFLKNFYFKASEFFVFEQDTPRFSAYSTIAVTGARVLFSGWRFKVRPLPAPAVPKQTIYISGW